MAGYPGVLQVCRTPLHFPKSKPRFPYIRNSSALQALFLMCESISDISILYFGKIIFSLKNNQLLQKHSSIFSHAKCHIPKEETSASFLFYNVQHVILATCGSDPLACICLRQC